jgi:hypothetical protein
VSELLARPYGWRETLAAYEDERDKEFTIYLQERAHYYAAEQRFDTPFWQRRQVLRRCLTDAADRTLAAATA